jgi:hypothetical protein
MFGSTTGGAGQGQGRSMNRFLLALVKAESPTEISTPALPEVRAAVAVGDRLRGGLAWEWTQIDVQPGDWREALTHGRVDVILIEIDAGTAPGWPRNELVAMLGWARAQDIPAVAWVTGGQAEVDIADPWLGSVTSVLVCKDEHLSMWRERHPDVSIGVAPAAVQPRRHNPRRGGTTRREPAAGILLDRSDADALNAELQLPPNRVDIWPTNPRDHDTAERAGLEASLVPAQKAQLLSRALDRYSVIADVGDPDGVAWQALEAGSAQTAVAATTSALARFPSDLRHLVTEARTPDELRQELAVRVWQRELRDREGVRLSREIHARHTFAHRVDAIADAVGLTVKRPGRSVSAIVTTNRAHELDNALANVGRQAHAGDGGVELILILHGLDVRRAEIAARARDAGITDVTVLEADSSMTLGACMNLGLDAAGGDFVAKMDDDDYYGRHYLTDLVAAFSYTDAGIVGKWATYVWLRSIGAVVLRRVYAEHRPERLVQGATITMRRDVARELRFSDIPRGIDTDLLNRAQEAGITTYSADRFNFVVIRNADLSTHTWTIADSALMNRASSLVFYGDPRSHVEV